MGLINGTISRTGGPGIVRDHDGAPATPGVPRPGQIPDPLRIRPAHIGNDEVRGAIVFTDLARHNGYHGGDGSYLGVPATGGITRVEVVDMEAGGELVQRIGW